MAPKKKVVKKAAVKKTVANTLSNKKLHVVLGDKMNNFEAKCESIGMTKSEVGRLLAETFIDGTVKIIPAKVNKKTIRA